MNISYEDLNESLRRIAIDGRMDITGTEQIATQFTALAASGNRRVIVDLSAVSFLASIGIRALITAAKSVQQRGGRMVLLVGGNETVKTTLSVTGIDAILPMFSDAAEAEAAVVA
ncbi:MAG: STAS domain-containing protein [Burkholderiales bacterium]